MTFITTVVKLVHKLLPLSNQLCSKVTYFFSTVSVLSDCMKYRQWKQCMGAGSAKCSLYACSHVVSSSPYKENDLHHLALKSVLLGSWSR